MQIGVRLQSVHCYVSKKVFVVFFPSVTSAPRRITMHKKGTGSFTVSSNTAPTALVCMMYDTRVNDSGQTVTHPLGSALLSLDKPRVAHATFRDYSAQPPLKMGTMTVALDATLPVLRIENTRILRDTYSAAEANLAWIGGFGKHGLPPVDEGLRLVHSPYYINHLGMCLPSGAFCMIRTDFDDQEDAATQSHRERLHVALCRNMMTPEDFVRHCGSLEARPLNRHQRACLQVIADAITLHARVTIRYTADTKITSKLESTERWEIPREPSEDGGQTYNGDCEDYAREIYQQVREIDQLVAPKWNGTPLESMAAVLQMYVPTIEQGAVASFAHTKYITYAAKYRNHIWGALHPRHAWLTNVEITSGQQDMLEQGMRRLYDKWPQHPCEPFLPLLHLEGTGDVLPVVLPRVPKTVAKLQEAKWALEATHPELKRMTSTDMSMQMHHASAFYKFAVACMTDVFSECGWLDYTYVSDTKYGAPFAQWVLGEARMRPSASHSHDTMDNIRKIITVERPIRPLLTTSLCLQAPRPFKRFVRYGQKTPIEKIHTNRDTQLATYKIHDCTWYEIYFKV